MAVSGENSNGQEGNSLVRDKREKRKGTQDIGVVSEEDPRVWE